MLNGFAAVFDSAIKPYMIDQGTTSTTAVVAADPPAVVPITLAANPTVTGATVNVYGNLFQQGAELVVDVGPLQEQNVVIMGLAGLTAYVTLTKAHGAYGPYPVVMQGGEFLVRDILARLDILNLQLKGFAPVVAGVAEADEAKLFASRRGRSGQKGVMDDLIDQRDWARKDLAALLGLQNLWEIRGKFGSGSALTYEAY